MAVGLFQHADVDMAELLRDQEQRRAVHGRQGGPRVTQCVGKLTQGLMSARWHVCAIRAELMSCPPRLAAWRCLRIPPYWARPVPAQRGCRLQGPFGLVGCDGFLDL